jgi:hypothetical protein
VGDVYADEATKLFESFKAWYLSVNGIETKLTQKKFGTLLKLRFQSERGRDGVFYKGIQLNEHGIALVNDSQN